MLLAHVNPADVIGESLRLHLGPTEWPAVASRTLHEGPLEVEIEVLAASHRVQVRRSPATAPVVVETVACGTAAAPPVHDEQLPPVHHVDLGDATYRFTSSTATGHDAVRRAADEVRTIERGLRVAFPGHPDALTGIRLLPTAGDAHAPTVAWTTHHVYPGPAPHVVTTSSTLTFHRRSR